MRFEGVIRELPNYAALTGKNTSESPRYARCVPVADRLDLLRKEMKFDFSDLGNVIVSEQNMRQRADPLKEKGVDAVVSVSAEERLRIPHMHSRIIFRSGSFRSRFLPRPMKASPH